MQVDSARHTRGKWLRGRSFWAVFLSGLALFFLLGWLTLHTLQQDRLRHALYNAVIAHDAAGVKSLLDRGADVNTRDWYTQANWEDDLPNTVFMVAARQGDKEIVRLMLARDAEVDSASQDGDTALMWAAQEGHADIVRMLVARGANVQASNRSGQTALHLAALSGDVATCDCLLEHGADLHASDKDGTTALMAAAWKGHDAAVSLLLERGADPDAKDKGGDTALTNAANEHHLSTVRLLTSYKKPLQREGSP